MRCDPRRAQLSCTGQSATLTLTCTPTVHMSTLLCNWRPVINDGRYMTTPSRRLMHGSRARAIAALGLRNQPAQPQLQPRPTRPQAAAVSALCNPERSSTLSAEADENADPRLRGRAPDYEGRARASGQAGTGPGDQDVNSTRHARSLAGGVRMHTHPAAGERSPPPPAAAQLRSTACRATEDLPDAAPAPGPTPRRQRAILSNQLIDRLQPTPSPQTHRAPATATGDARPWDQPQGHDSNRVTPTPGPTAADVHFHVQVLPACTTAASTTCPGSQLDSSTLSADGRATVDALEFDDNSVFEFDWEHESKHEGPDHGSARGARVRTTPAPLSAPSAADPGTNRGGHTRAEERWQRGTTPKTPGCPPPCAPPPPKTAKEPTCTTSDCWSDARQIIPNAIMATPARAQPRAQPAGRNRKAESAGCKCCGHAAASNGHATTTPSVSVSPDVSPLGPPHQIIRVDGFGGAVRGIGHRPEMEQSDFSSEAALRRELFQVKLQNFILLNTGTRHAQCFTMYISQLSICLPQRWLTSRTKKKRACVTDVHTQT